MPSKNKKREFKVQNEIKAADNHPQKDGVDNYTVSPIEVYFKILNHITSGNILNEKENIKHKTFLSQTANLANR